ncbi:MAG: anti-sigma factor [Candidatus Angelobacter sp.]
MNCEWRDKIGLYVDGEMEPAPQQAFSGHLQGCTNCAAAVLEQQELKKAVRIAGKRFTPPPELYASVRRQIRPDAGAKRWWTWGLISAGLVLFVALGFSWYSRSRTESAIVAQLVDLHVTMLASGNPVDVISEDRHTVKPWFQGKLPFAFNLPELDRSDFKLLGGKLVYLQHSPGAELVYQVRLHKMSVFIFQLRDAAVETPTRGTAFTVTGWQQGGLQYYVVTDAAKEDAARLRGLLQDANRS